MATRRRFESSCWLIRGHPARPRPFAGPRWVSGGCSWELCDQSRSMKDILKPPPANGRPTARMAGPDSHARAAARYGERAPADDLREGMTDPPTSPRSLRPSARSIPSRQSHQRPSPPTSMCPPSTSPPSCALTSWPASRLAAAAPWRRALGRGRHRQSHLLARLGRWPTRRAPGFLTCTTPGQPPNSCRGSLLNGRRQPVDAGRRRSLAATPLYRLGMPA